jgi:hypothetical protein
MSASSTWSTLAMGRHRGFSLPQIIFRDADWFFWAWGKGVFTGRYPEAHEAKRIYDRATRVRIPNAELVVEYLTDRSSGRFAGMQLARAGDSPTNPSFLRHVIDLSVPSQLRNYDKSGMKIMIKDFKEIVFGDPKVKMTRRRAEMFFDDDRNFVLGDEAICAD